MINIMVSALNEEVLDKHTSTYRLYHSRSSSLRLPMLKPVCLGYPLKKASGKTTHLARAWDAMDMFLSTRLIELSSS